MIPSRWMYCAEHKNHYPKGRMCPECKANIKARYDAALVPAWKDIIPFDRMLEFITTEHIYCRDEENAFYNYKGVDANNKEKLRVLVLEKRQEFLQLFIQIMQAEMLGE